MAKKIFSLVVVDSVEYKPSGKHTVDFHRLMSEIEKRTREQWEGCVKAFIDDYDDDKRAAQILAWDVYDYLKQCWWWDDKFKDSVTVRCAMSEVNTEGRCWHRPCTTSSDLTVCLGDLKNP